jgi:hypothetical protein
MTEQSEWQDTENDAPFEDEWQEVESEVMIKFETQGDGFMARYLGMDPRNANGIIQAHFTNVSDLEAVFIADTAFLNVTRDLENKLRKVPVKSMVRVQWTDSMDTGHESGTPMRVFTVRHKR